MAKDRIPDTTIDDDYEDGQILYGSDLNKLISVFKEGVNKNKTDLNRIITGGDYFFIADDLTGLNDLLSEQIPNDGDPGFIFDGETQTGYIETYKYNEGSGTWNFESLLRLNGTTDIKVADAQPEDQIVGDFWYDTSD